jgi:membrane protein YdbS with pleckstrin-like domain
MGDNQDQRGIPPFFLRASSSRKVNVMSRQTMITGAVFVIVGAIVLAVLQYVVHLQGAVLKLIIGVVIALIAAGIAFYVTKPTGTAA